LQAPRFQVFNQDALAEIQSGEAIDPEKLELGRVFGGFFFWSILSMIVGLVITAVMLNMVADADRSGAPDVNAALSKSFSRLLALLGLVLLSTISIMAGFVLLVIPGIWIAVSLVPALAIFFLEDKGPVDSFKESIGLVRGSWWPVFGVILSIGVFTFVLGFFRLLPGPVGFLLGVVVAAVTIVVQAAAVYFTFEELRGASSIEDVRTT